MCSRLQRDPQHISNQRDVHHLRSMLLICDVDEKSQKKECAELHETNDNDLQITLLGSTIGHMQMQNMKCTQKVLLRALQMTLAILVNTQLHNTFSIVWDCCGVFCFKKTKSVLGAAAFTRNTKRLVWGWLAVGFTHKLRLGEEAGMVGKPFVCYAQPHLTRPQCVCEQESHTQEL